MRPVQALIAGVAALLIAMGVGRFAYTPILPLMQLDAHFTESMAGLLASMNYLGYLLGALAASFLYWKRGRAFYLKMYLILNIATTLLMGLTSDYALWSILRLISGLSSGIVFVLASSVVLEVLERHQRRSWSGVFYGGVGLGICLCGIVVPIFEQALGWEWAWIGLGLLSAAIGTIPFVWIKEEGARSQAATNEPANVPAAERDGLRTPLFKRLLLSYGCEGIGYIVTGTFLVAMVRDIPRLEEYANLSWTFVGLAAVPSCVVWAMAAKKYGHIKALYGAFAVQIVGVIMPVLTHSAIGVLLGALLFGGTFMGIVTLTVSYGKMLSPHNSRKAIGYLTASFGAGQIVGPIVAGNLTARTGSYNEALVFASAVLFLGLAL
ncbi:MAG: major facilitator superfamily transporter [Paenibacillaceae bacterium]|nr:major facilitator superfamily transporter [Paenibacillaceae bacterium]